MTSFVPARFYTTDRYARLIVRCQDRPCTAYDAAEFLGVAHGSAIKYLHHAHKTGALRIHGWRAARRTGPYQACYGVADGQPDAPKPVPLTLLERVKAYQKTEKGKAAMKRYKERRKKDPEHAMNDKAYSAARHARSKPMPKIPSLLDQLSAMVK